MKGGPEELRVKGIHTIIRPRKKHLTCTWGLGPKRPKREETKDNGVRKLNPHNLKHKCSILGGNY